ncbi:hexaprenyldihydroxybenzoate methyltransferase, mitochondrial [Camelus ferus]|nr:hexaprenyldihydroxybenzoate methyltransferase, mitochondrial [Camelus ferus]
MEREKQKKLEKERMEQQRSQLSKKEKKATEDSEGGDGPRLPQRSKFDSDEEDEDTENVEAASSGKVTRSPSPVPQEEQSEPEMTEEEKEYQMMLLTKMLLTEILLDVTDEEIYYVAKDAHRKATKGGLGGYGSGDSEDERSDRGSESSDTDDEELRHRIRQKQEAFWRKEKELQLLHDKQMEVTGIDPVDENIKTAQHHKSFDPVLDKRIEYRACSLEEIVEETAETFDAVIASEVVEHVIDLETFIQCCCQVLKPGGSLFITTINKTQLSYALGIVFAEQIAGIVPKGTHTWEKFVSPEKLESILESNGLSVLTVAGMVYNPFSGYWHWSENTSLNYAAHAVKSSVQEHVVPAKFALKGETEELRAEASHNSGVREELKR